MMKLVGYLTNYPDGLLGEKGIYYNYITASNGLFIEAENSLISARIPIAECSIRGLAPLKKKITLLYGSIPQRFFDLSLNLFLSDINIEHYVAIVGDAGYKFHIPVQDRSGGGVVYEAGKNIVLEMHSHGKMHARFSPTDDKDESGLKVFGVIGDLDKRPVVQLRIGVYGYFFDLSWKEVFDGSLIGADEYSREEVIAEYDLPDIFRTDVFEQAYHPGWLWRHRWLRC
jgi:PRTRC genetic system protein A